MVDLRVDRLRRFGTEHRATVLGFCLFSWACAPTDDFFIDTSAPFSANDAGIDHTGGGGSGGSSGTGGASGTGGSAGSGTGGVSGTGGSAGSGTGGASGTGGSAGGAGGSDAGADSAGIDAATSDALDAAPSRVDAGGMVVFADDFENDTVGALPPGWTRVGGSSGDWAVTADSTHVLAQSNSPSSTLRVCYAGAATSNAASVSARVKLMQNGSSGTTTAMICIRYVPGSGDYQCLALEAGAGVRIKTNQGDSPGWPSAIALGTWYRLKLAIDPSGLLTAYLENNLLGTFRPPVGIASGSVAVSTQSAEAAFDDVVLSTP